MATGELGGELALDPPPAARAGQQRRQLQAVIVTAQWMRRRGTAWCREQGLFPAELDAWFGEA